MTEEEHPNIALLKKLDPANMAAATELFAKDVVFHYFNSRLPELQGDYVGLTGVQSFFSKLAEQSRGTFKVNPISLTAVGNELVVAQCQNTLVLDEEQIVTDVVVVWRFVEGRIAEVWDIPSLHEGVRKQPRGEMCGEQQKV